MSLVQASFRRPFKQPYQEIFTANEQIKLRFIPTKAKRLCLPSDYANDKLYCWNQKLSKHHGNPWKGNYASDGRFGFICMTLINSGNNCYLHSVAPYERYTSPIEPKEWSRFQWTHDKLNRIYSFQFYLNNDLEEINPLVIYDDDESVWSAYLSGSGSFSITLSEELSTKIKGESSLKANVISGSYADVGYQIDYTNAQNWSNKEFLCWYFYGNNSGLTIKARIIDNAQNYAQWILSDNFIGWKRFVKPLLKPDSQSDAPPDLAQIKMIRFYFTPTSSITFYHDRTLIDNGRWVKVEHYAPNVLRNPGIYSYPKGYLYTWDVSSSSWKRCWENYNELNSNNFYLMDGTRLSDIYSSSPIYRRGQVGYLEGLRGETKGAWRADGAPDSPKYITYSSYYGCKNRIGFAVKLPPDDNRDSSNYGISQAKLKLEIYYDDNGKTTYEFEDSLNQYYGLMNMNKQWLALFSSELKIIEYLIFTKRPVAMEICSDNNEDIKYIDITLKKGTRVFSGSLYHSDHFRDSDADGIPDIFEENKWVPSICESVYRWE